MLNSNQVLRLNIHSIFGFHSNFWFYWLAFFCIIIGRYFVTAGSVYWFLYVFLGQYHTASRYRKTPHQKTMIASDIRLSTLSAIVFSLIAACFMKCYDSGLTHVYTQWKLQDSGYLILSYVIVLLLQDTCFYFIHRLLHVPLLFKWFHQGHHRSKIPTPWTSFAFDPLEAAIQASFLFIMTLIIPLHIGVLIALSMTMTVSAVTNHLGYSIIPDSWFSHCLGTWFIGPTHHLVHHRRYTQNYGLYFTFWDRILKTQNNG